VAVLSACCSCVGGGPAAFRCHGPSCHTPSASAAAPTTLPVHRSARDLACAVTVTSAVALAPSHVQVIVAAPGRIAVTRPSSVTVATSVSVEAQRMAWPTRVPPFVPLGRAVSCTAPPTATETWAGLSVSPVTAVAGLGAAPVR